MTNTDKLKKIIDLQSEKFDWKINPLNDGVNENQLAEIEKLIDDKLPAELSDFYLANNGESGDERSCFLGHRFMPINEVIKQIEFGLSLVKPAERKLNNPEKSKGLLNKIVDFYFAKAPKKGLFKKSWYKIEFSCGLGSYGGPYLYKSEKAEGKGRETIDINFDDYKKLSPLVKELHELEKDSYNWDELEFVMYSEQKYEVKRTDYNFNEEIPFTSTPVGAIKKMYFNPKWIPVFSDHGGNYIGIDLDPDTNGINGQVIIFGRDEEDMFVLSNSITDFFDLIISKIVDESVDFKKELHFHEILKDMINNGK
ncbi:SMI1/KNR4 family protein [Williamwhitmania taraxaci]|uniref:SMI1 / KNR4 family (SUKH-1) n=1 Tax=Williamwhitmania taraxaci TaxID=1640674 RepID=A0A1G6H5E6_9BACT|nr:SMI1/KNR4 family protein [Williamwhitmania taraxaci]SDB89510.1 SMI1 / KNR4 family (SUKH-1) [Williamwhitmania taraxaci]